MLALFDPAFGAYAQVLLVVCSAAVLRAIFGPSITVLASHERQGDILALLAVGVALSLALAFALYPALGVLGIAVAYSLSVIVGRKRHVVAGKAALRHRHGDLGEQPDLGRCLPTGVLLPFARS